MCEHILHKVVVASALTLRTAKLHKVIANAIGNPLKTPARICYHTQKTAFSFFIFGYILDRKILIRQSKNRCRQILNRVHLLFALIDFIDWMLLCFTSFSGSIYSLEVSPSIPGGTHLSNKISSLTAMTFQVSTPTHSHTESWRRCCFGKDVGFCCCAVSEMKR